MQEEVKMALLMFSVGMILITIGLIKKHNENGNY